MHRFRAGVVALGLFASVGCGPADDEPPSREAAALSEKETLRLESLGYLDFSPEAPSAPEPAPPTAPARPHPGYDLYTFPGLFRAELRDLAGRLLREWHGEGGRWERATFAPTGDLLVVSARDGQRRLARYGFDGALRWERPLPAHHLVVERPDGTLFTLTSRLVDSPVAGRDGPLVENGLARLSAQGEILEERPLTALLAAGPAPFPLRELTREDPDLFHANYFSWMPGGTLAGRDPLYAASNVLVTIREQDAVVVFDFARGETLWWWGPGEIRRPHEASVLCDGHFLIFDNRMGEGWSRVIELDPLTREIVWEFRAEPREAFYSATRGTAQRLPNGHTLIGSSNQGRAFEVDADGGPVWQFVVPYADRQGRRATFRVNRHEAAFVEALLRGEPPPGPILAAGCR